MTNTATSTVLSQFASMILAGQGIDGFPVSTRCVPVVRGDVMIIDPPEWFQVLAGQASLTGHSHDQDGWGLRHVVIRGRLEHRDHSLVFVPSATVWGQGGSIRDQFGMIMRARRDARTYLRREGISAPPVPWSLMRRARAGVRANRPTG